VYLTYFYRFGYLYAKNYQIWWRFDEVLTKTTWVIFGTPCIYQWRIVLHNLRFFEGITQTC